MNLLLQSLLFGAGICFIVWGANALPPANSVSISSFFLGFLALTVLFLGGALAGAGLHGLIKDAVGK